jgi:hypothetical protein
MRRVRARWSRSGARSNQAEGTRLRRKADCHLRLLARGAAEFFWTSSMYCPLPEHIACTIRVYSSDSPKSSLHPVMPPFSEANQLVHDLVPEPGAAQSETMPGQPSIPLKEEGERRNKGGKGGGKKSETGEGFRTCCSQSAKRSRSNSCKSPESDQLVYKGSIYSLPEFQGKAKVKARCITVARW